LHQALNDSSSDIKNLANTILKNQRNKMNQDIIAETKSTAGVMSLSDPRYKKDTGDMYNPVTTDLRGERSKTVTYDPTTKKNVVVSKPAPTQGQMAGNGSDATPQASTIKPNTIPTTLSQKKELSPFEKEFARARAAGEKEFTWKNKEGRSYQVGTKLKGEVQQPVTTTKTAITPTKNVTVSKDEMSRIDVKKPDAAAVLNAEPTSTLKEPEFDRQKSDKMWADTRAEIAADKATMTPQQLKDLEDSKAEFKQEIDARIAAKEKKDAEEDKQKKESKTNEETQMSINKKFNVSDALYQSVMEVMKKPSAGSTPRNEKEKDLAAMSPPGHLITHGDVLKARGVSMKEAKKLDPVGKEDEDVDNDGKMTSSDSYLKNRRKAIGAAMKEDIEQVNELKKSTIASYIQKKFGKMSDEPTSKNQYGYAKKDAKGIRSAGLRMSGIKATQNEGTMRGGKYVNDAPKPGTNEVPSPDEGYRPPKKAMKPGSTTKVSMDVEEENVQDMSSKMKMKLGLYGKKKSAMKENTDTPGNGYEHQCAIHVKSESFGEGRTITTQHADLDENGHIAWYDVMFEHGIEKYVPTAELEILVSESHMHSMKKKKKM